jgi:hypothetical protein
MHFGFSRKVLWSHPAFAARWVFARNDRGNRLRTGVEV